MLYFVTYPDWDGHWHKYYNRSVCLELDKHQIEYTRITTDYASDTIQATLMNIQKIDSSDDDTWLFSIAQNPVIELVERRPGKKFGHIHGLNCFPFEPATLQGVDLKESERLGYYDGLFLSSDWSYENACRCYPEHEKRFTRTGLPVDFDVYRSYRHLLKQENLVVFNQRLSCERLPLIEIQLATQLIALDCEVWHLYAPLNGKITGGCPWVNRLRQIGESSGIRFVACPSKDIYHRHLARAHAVVTTSICDNLPVALIEAIYLGAVPVAPNAMCFPEFVHRDNLYTPYSLNEMVERVTHAPCRHHPIAQYDRKTVLDQYLQAMQMP